MTGDTGMKIHAGRSRNDQVLTDIYLYLRDEASANRGMFTGYSNHWSP
jgi:argininosuccinate lyase